MENEYYIRIHSREIDEFKRKHKAIRRKVRRFCLAGMGLCAVTSALLIGIMIGEGRWK